MKPKEKISETYIAQFDSKCETCLRRRSDGVCAYSGYQIDDIMFDMRRYFGFYNPRPRPIPCPVFNELKRKFDEDLLQIPAKMEHEEARRKAERLAGV